jgi:hypothetical protein
VRLDTRALAGATTVANGDGHLLTLSPQLFEAGGFTRVGLFANGGVQVTADVDFDLGAYGEIDIGAGEVDISGKLRAADGRIAVNALPTVSTGNDATALSLKRGRCTRHPGSLGQRQRGARAGQRRGRGALGHRRRRGRAHRHRLAGSRARQPHRRRRRCT